MPGFKHFKCFLREVEGNNIFPCQFVLMQSFSAFVFECKRIFRVSDRKELGCTPLAFNSTCSASCCYFAL